MSDKQVALLIETSSSWGQQIIAGIGDYVRRHGRWILFVDHRGTYEKQTIPAGWAGDGIIARVTSPELAAQVTQAGTPCVNVSTIRVPRSQIQQVTVNEDRVGQIGAETLLAAGLAHFGYFGPPSRPFYRDRVQEGFARQLAAAGHAPATFAADRVLRSDADPQLDLQPLAEWLASRPKPVGILCWNALGARRVTEACYAMGIRVPEDASIIGGDYDQLTAEIAVPHLTCVDQAPRALGLAAAAELDRLMVGGAPGESVLREPSGVLWRDSVVNPAIRDPVVEQALQLIRQNAAGTFDIARLLDALPVARRSLELRFQRALGHGPGTEIRQVRLREAQRLLAETDLQIKEVSWRAGLKGPEQLQRLLRKATSLSPSQYRKAHRRQPNDAT